MDIKGTNKANSLNRFCGCARSLLMSKMSFSTYVAEVANSVSYCSGKMLSFTLSSVLLGQQFSNPLVLVGIATELMLAAFIIYTPTGNQIFGCAPIGINVWLLLIPFALLLLAADKTRKYVVRCSIGNQGAKF
jgi:hypothetical protein